MIYLIIVNVLIFAVGIIYYLTKVKGKKRKVPINVQEIVEALEQAERYSDKAGWIEVRMIDRDRYIDKGFSSRRGK
jgi:hypothetical protein